MVGLWRRRLLRGGGVGVGALSVVGFGYGGHGGMDGTTLQSGWD